MILKLQIALTILACLFVVAVFPVATWLSLGWGLATALCALLCYCGVLLCKQRTQTQEPQKDVESQTFENSEDEGKEKSVPQENQSVEENTNQDE